jgi:multiple sugar transport system substrate-binding protein
MMDLVQELLDEFNKTVGAEKGIEVEMQVLGDDAANVFLAAQKNQQGPDLYNCPTGYQGFQAEYEAGLKIYWDDLPGFAEWKAQWPDWYWREGVTTWQGHVYAVPFTVYNGGLVYNKDLFKEAGITELPKTYADVREAAKKITAINGKYGLAVPGKDSWFTMWMISQLAEANGYPVWWDWTTGKYEFSNFADIYQLILDIQADGSMFPGVTSLANDPLRAQFAAGNIGMFFAENWDVGVLNDQFPAKDDWGVMLPVPTVDGEQHGKTRAFMAEGLWSINGATEYKEEAWEVVKFFLLPEKQARFYEEGKIIPPNPEITAKAEKTPAQKGFADFAQAVESAYVATFLNIPGFQELPENPCHLLTQLLSKGGDVKAELQTMEDAWNEALDTFYAENPDVKREWNMYPNFDRMSGDMGQPASAQ